MSESQSSNFGSWAVVELMGHQVIAGMVTEQTIAGSPLLRVDVPESDVRPAFTKYFGGGAIYAISPCTEEAAKAVVDSRNTKPITVYAPKLDRLEYLEQRYQEESANKGKESIDEIIPF